MKTKLPEQESNKTKVKIIHIKNETLLYNQISVDWIILITFAMPIFFRYRDTKSRKNLFIAIRRSPKRRLNKNFILEILNTPIFSIFV